MIVRLAFWPFPQVKLFIFRKEPQTSKTGEATWFLRTFDGSFIVAGHPYDHNDLLTLKHLSTGAALPRPVNIEKCIVVPDQDTFDLQPPSDTVVVPESEKEVPAPAPNVSHVHSELSQVAYEFGKYLSSLPNKTATASQAGKQVYMTYPSAREILTRHGKLHGLVKSCPYLQMDGATHGGLHLLPLNQEIFSKLFHSIFSVFNIFQCLSRFCSVQTKVVIVGVFLFVFLTPSCLLCIVYCLCFVLSFVH